MRLTDVIQRPLVTEKATRQGEAANEYFFAVHAKANKHLIREAVEKLFKVKVVSVRTLSKPGWKKAMVRLREKETIKLFEGK